MFLYYCRGSSVTIHFLLNTMEATSNKPSLLLSKYFQVIHLCLSIAVVFAMVHNQLVNDGRFKKLEHEVYRQENANTVREIFPQKKNLESLHKVIKRNVPMGINKDIKKSTRDSRKEKVIDKSKRDVLACLDVLRTFANRSRTNVELNLCKQFRGLPGQPGTKGTRGKRGKQGKRGLQGQKGKIGKEGSMGKHGPPGPRGEKGFSGNVTVIGFKGDTGPKGDNGDKGHHGARGPPGDKGSKGEAGGPKGDPGDRGEKGSIGQRGCPGDRFAAPRFYASPKHLVFTERETATLFCNATANPYSHITWYLNSVTPATNGRYDVDQNVKVPSASFLERAQCNLKSHSVTQSSLVIQQSRGNDTGSYFCEARNVMGVSRYEIRLLIHVYVQFIITPTNMTVNETENIRLRCRASGVPSPVITWQRKDNGPMPNRYSVAMGDLLISEITKEDDGVYQCVASNVLGSRTTEANITVNVFPVIVSFEENTLTVNESQTLALPCSATGFPQPAITWNKKSGHLPEGRYTYDSQRLSISNVKYVDRGEYVCTANSTLGAVSETVRVIVQAEPLFRPNPQRLVFNEANVAVLTCTAVANPSAQITWYRDNMLINEQRDSTSYTIENRDVTPRATARAKNCPSEIPHPVEQSTLIINKSNGSDTGTYSCMARNILGTTSFKIDILVQVHVQLTTTPSNIAVVQDESVLLSCRASGVPRPTITWYRKDDGPMPSQHSVAMGDLRIKNISKGEEGTFVCLAENALGSKTTEATVKVNVFPEIISFANHVITVNESNSLVLPCNATGHPFPVLRWTKRNDFLPAGRYYFDSQVLNITNVTYEDGGEYICTANNTVGLVNRSVQVLVQVAPKHIEKPKVTEFGYRGHDTILNFRVLAYPPATIQWMKYGKVLQTLNQSSSSLTLTNVQYKHSGLYQAVARNILGEARVTTFLIVRDPVPAGITSTINEKKYFFCPDNVFSKACSALGNPTPTIVWKHNGVTLMSITGTRLTLNITNLNTTHAGRYTCEASNRFGTARQLFDLDQAQKSVFVETGCKHTRINGYSGRIMSPNYPGNYANSKKCSWKLTSCVNINIVLLFEQFNTEAKYDKVKVYNGGSASSSSLGEFSGTMPPSTPSQITSTSHQLYITFNTDGSGTGSGFSIKYQAAGP